MMTPIFVIFDVIVVPSGDLAIGGTDEYLDRADPLIPERFEGKLVSLVLRGGQRVETRALGLAVHTALTEQRNVFLRIPNVVASVDTLRGAIVSVEFDENPSG